MVSDLEHLDAINVAFAAGYDLGHAHGRRDERAIIDQERRSAAAGAVVTRLAALPPLDPAQLERERAARAATRERLAQLKAPAPARRTA